MIAKELQKMVKSITMEICQHNLAVGGLYSYSIRVCLNFFPDKINNNAKNFAFEMFLLSNGVKTLNQ